MGKRLGENITKTLCRKLLDHAKKSATDAIKIASKKQFKKQQKQRQFNR